MTAQEEVILASPTGLACSSIMDLACGINHGDADSV